MTGKEKVQKLLNLIKRGKTVLFTTYLKSYKVDKKTVNKFEDAGYEVLKGTEKSIYMLSGKSYICMDGCKITYS